MKNKHIIIVVICLALGIVGGCNVDKTSAPAASSGSGTSIGSIGGMTITASPASLTAYQSSVITVNLIDSTGNTYTGSATVSFTLDSVYKGTLSSSTAQAANGSASVTFTAGAASTVAVLYASVGTAYVGIPISITGTTPANIVVSAVTNSLTAGNTTTITASVTDGLGFPVYGATVAFAVDNALNGALSSSSVMSDTNGQAVVTLTATAGPTVTVSASTLGASGSVIINVSGTSLVGTLTLSSAASSIVTNGTMTFTASLRDATNYPIPNATITFSNSNSVAGTLSSVSVVTDANGIASVGFQAGVTPSSTSISAAYSTLGLSASVNLDVTSPPAAEIVTSASPTVITVRGTSNITATLYADNNKNPVLDNTQVSFSLSDSSFGTLSNTTVGTAGGVATVSFTAANKTGTVTISITSGTITKTETILIDPAATGSIQYVSATPTLIGVKGSGYPETSSVTFMVSDTTGSAVSDGSVVVYFTLNGPGGGAYIGSSPTATPVTSTTTNGNATVLLNSGAVAGPCTVTAKVQVAGGAWISSASSSISIGGGVADYDHFDLSATVLNLPGLVVSGATTSVIVKIADRFGNKNILAGTSVSFRTESGAIDAQATTDSQGNATAGFRTQLPDPVSVSSTTAEIASLLTITSTYTSPSYSVYNITSATPRNGQNSILAAVMGQESFIDEDADGMFTASYTNSAVSPCPSGYTCECAGGGISIKPTDVTRTCTTGTGYRSEGFKDIGEPYVDSNDDGCRNDGSYKYCDYAAAPELNTDPFEEYIDPNSNKSYDGPNGLWDGPSCTTPGCQTSKMIWKNLKIQITGDPFYYALSPISIPTGTVGVTETIHLIVGDKNLNALTSGSTIVIDHSTTALEINGSSSFNWTYTVPDNATKATDITFTVGATIPVIESVQITITNKATNNVVVLTLPTTWL